MILRADELTTDMAISQKLHTKLVQKLILTPSLQQAIKLLPMSTLELSELLNQEMVENPMLEEVPTEELQPVEAAPRKSRKRRRTRRRRHLGRPGLRVLLRRLPRRRLPAAHADRSQGAPADREHALDAAVALRSPALAAVDADRRADAARDRRGHHRQPRRRRLSRGDGGRVSRHGTVAHGRRRALAHAGPEVRSDWRRRARPAGVPAAAAATSGHDRHAGGKDRHRAHAAPAEPPGAGARAQARAVDRRSQAAHRADSASRSEAGQPLQPVAVAVRHPRRVHRQGRGSVRRGAQRGGAAAAADQPGLPPPARQERRRRTPTRRAPT